MGVTILLSSSLKIWGTTTRERAEEAHTSFSVCHFNKNDHRKPFLSLSSTLRHSVCFAVSASSFSSPSSPKSSTRLYVSGLFFSSLFSLANLSIYFHLCFDFIWIYISIDLFVRSQLLIFYYGRIFDTMLPLFSSVDLFVTKVHSVSVSTLVGLNSVIDFCFIFSFFC